MESIPTRNRKIGPDHPVYVIAELAWSHDGSEEKASAIIRGACDAGADAISVHVTALADYMVPHYGNGKGRVSAGKEDRKIYEYLENINLPPGAWGELLPLARDLGLDICAMCNDWASLDLMDTYSPDMYVISAASFVEEDFVREIARRRKPLILRVGGASLGEMEKVIRWAREEGNRQSILLFGFQNYPTRIEETHLAFLRTLRETFGLQVGLADHLDADKDMAVILPLLAVPYGATVIEKHVTHDRSLKGEDFESALNPPELKRLVSYLRQVEKAIGLPHMEDFFSSMANYRQVSRKRIVARRPIRMGDVITREDITCKRSDAGAYPDEIRYVLGRKLITDLDANDAILLEDLR